MKITLYVPDGDRATLKTVKRIVHNRKESVSQVFVTALRAYAVAHAAEWTTRPAKTRLNPEKSARAIAEKIRSGQ